MKNIAPVIVLVVMAALFAIAVSWPSKVKADPPRTPRAAVLIGYTDRLGPYVTERRDDGTIFSGHYTIGMRVWFAETSPNCPPITAGEPLGPVMERLLEAGFRLEDHNIYGKMLFIR